MDGREIIASQLTNDMVDLMGSAFVYRVARDTGHTESDIARAWFAAASLAGADELRRRLEELEGEVPSQVVYRWLLGLSRVLERTTRWILTNVPPGTPITDVVSRYLEGVTVLRRDFRSVVVGHEREYGYFSLDELEAISGPGGLRIERDLYWTPKPLTECR